MTDERRRERDLILAPNEYAYLLDETKGNVINYVGPHKTSLANTDQPVSFNSHTKRFERCSLDEAIHQFAIAPEGWYLMLKNPAADAKFARIGTANALPDLDIGRKINIPGPVSFAPWPGQMFKVIQGHRLRSNQYLIVRVYDEEGAKTNWAQAVIKRQGNGENVTVELPDLTMGKLLVIKGTEVSFYIPPTGVEVVQDEYGQYVREAVTLERLEYCILLDESGHKRYIQGPAVVFPQPTETFIEKNGIRKFKAIELNEISGLYIKVIAPYEEGGNQYQVGEELFLTGKDQMIYFPRPEHAIVRYDDNEVNYAVAIPEGEARYVMNRLTGQITLQRGPSVFLPDPRQEVIVRRVLSDRQIELWFPGNQEALAYNRKLRSLIQNIEEPLPDVRAKKASPGLMQTMAAPAAAPREEFVGDEFARKHSYTPPRTLTLDTKYEGAVAINTWTGYAVLVISKTGERKVVVGPQTHLLEYDETLGMMELSMGTPKTDDKLMRTVYLRVLHNKVSDLIEAETKDVCKVQIRLSYRVNFEGDPNMWFNVENYVKFLTDHTRSMLNRAIRQKGIEEFYANAIDIVRDTILGPAVDAQKRPGLAFSENGMRIYDVEVLEVEIEDAEIADLLVTAQHTNVQQALDLETRQRGLIVTQQTEQINQQIATAAATTQQLLLGLQIEEAKARHNLELATIEAKIATQKRQLEARMAEQTGLDQINSAELARLQAKQELEVAIAQQKLAQRLEELRGEVEAVVSKAGAVSPQLVSALQSFSDKALAERVAESMSPLAILGGRSVAEVFAQLVKGTVLEQVLNKPEGNG